MIYRYIPTYLLPTKLALAVLSIIVIPTLILVFATPSALAASYSYTSGSDWSSGSLLNLESVSSEGDLNIKPTGTWGARTWRTPDLTIGVGSAFVSDDTDLYVMRGYGDPYFWKYSTEDDEWSNLTNLPYGTYYGSDMTKLDDDIYAIFGGYQKSFAKYSIANDSWEILTSVPDLVYYGGSITTDGTDIYALRGDNSQDFYKYDVSEGSWNSLAATPATVRQGADLVHLNGYIYTPRGNNQSSFYRYSISDNSWTAMANAPATIYDDMEITTDGTDIYVSRQNNTTSFYKYNVAGNSWSTLTAAPSASRYSGVVYNQNDGYIYFFRGNNTYDFWKYDIAENSYLGVDEASIPQNTGSDVIHYNGYLYMSRGGNNSAFQRYNIASNVWEARATSPAGFNDDTKGTAAGSYIYYYRGGNTTTVYRYNPAANSWTTMSGTTPSTVRFGGALAYPGSGDYIYGTRGNTQLSFWRYSISGDSWDDGAVADLPADAESSYGSRLVTDGTDIYYIAGIGISRMFRYSIGDDTWTEVASPPFAPYYGTDITYYNGNFYALAGGYKTDFYEYSIANDSWRKLDDLAAYYGRDLGTYNGASIESDDNGTLYITRGFGRYDMQTYTVSSDNYFGSGTWTSASQDLSYVAAWNSISSNATTPDDSAVSLETRTSADNVNWSSWQSVTGGVISSPAQRYIQVRVTLTASSDKSNTPTLKDLTINYTPDSIPPSNPTSFTGLSQEIGGESLTDDNYYSYTKPFFSWNGASDVETDVAGYYVYFGTNSTADPVTEGKYQSDADFQSLNITEAASYYLRIKTVDTVGNVSAATTGFTYHYQGISPAISINIDETAEFTGTATNVNVANDQIKLSSKAGFWIESQLSNAPGSIQYGAKNMAYVSASNKLYVFRGNNSTTFYEYDIDTDTWSTKAAAPATVRMGGGVTEGPEGYLYGLRGNNSTSFWRYDISENTWSDEDAADAPLTIYYGGSLVYDGAQYIYVMRGNNDDSFWRYDTQEDSWETLAKTDFGATSDAINNNVYVSADLAIDQTNQLIYATQGNWRDGFSVYDINTNDWTVLPDLPALPYLGSSIEYDDINQAVFFMPGYYQNKVFKYDVNLQEWEAVSPAPYGFYYGGNIQKAGSYLYALRGQNSTTFYKYDLAKDSWQIPTRGLFGTEFLGDDNFNVFYGADLVKGDGHNFYITRGNYDNSFVRWNENTGEITRMANTPVGLYSGSALVYDDTTNKIYLTGGVYVQKFYVYDIATNSWSEESADPLPTNVNYGTSMVYDGSRFIYMNRGGNGANFYQFDTQASDGNKWSSLANTPAGLGYGSELALYEGHIYTLRGANAANNPFYRYDISSDIWSDPAVADLSIDVNNDGFLANSNDGYFYAARGENDTEFFKYSINDDAWTNLADSPARINEGGSGESNNNNKIYMLPGGSSIGYQDALYTYVTQTENSSFVESGSYSSPSHDLTSVYKWINLQVTYDSATNTALTVETRSSADDTNWSSWTSVSKEQQVDNVYTYQINSPPNRYLQVKFNLSSADGIYSGTISDYTINYFQDTTEPSNPQTAGLSGYSDSSPGSPIITDTWYGYENPYFDWPDAEETNGASDPGVASGVAGYYIYFGTDDEADPETDGIYQTSSDFSASNLENNQSYVLKIKAVDDAGNIATEAWEPFTYKFDNDGPEPVTELTADPSGYSATNSFDFSWNEASSSGAQVSSYCYKTAASSGPYANDQCTTETSVTGVPAYKIGTNTFYVRSKDEAGNYSDYQSVLYFYVDVANAPSPPTNLSVTPEVNTTNSFAFDWDPPATGTFYGSASNLSYYYSINALPSANSVSSTSLTYLNAGAYATLPGSNMFYIVTKDEAGNINYSNYASVEFSANTTAPGVPLNIDIADVSVKATSSWKLALSWESPSNIGAGVNNYTIYRSTDGESFEEIATSGGISYVDVGLTQQTYYYRVKACDSTNNCGDSSEVVSLYPDGKFVEAAPLVAEPTVTGITTRKATVSWSTSRTSDSKIAYGTSSGEYFDEEVSNSEQVSSHIITIPNLSPGTTYYFVSKWTDEDGNTGISDEYTFTTDPPPSTEEPVVKNIGLDSALIEFTSKNASKVRVYYGETSAFGGMVEIATGSNESTHTVQLSDLTDGTKYYYKINSFDIEDEEYEGEIHSFATYPRPEVADISIKQVKGTAKSTLLISWSTNTEVSSIVTYYPTGSPGLAKDEVNVALKKDLHRMIIHNLEPNTSYTIIVKGMDVAGNEAATNPQTITTSSDTRPATISNFKVEGEIIGVGDTATAQLVVSYQTDEPTTSQVEYGEGSGSTYSQKTQEDSTLVTHHSIVISELSPSKIYHLRAISKDQAGNEAKSIDKVVITPKATENALDLVVSNMSSILGFLKDIEQ